MDLFQSLARHVEIKYRPNVGITLKSRNNVCRGQRGLFRRQSGTNVGKGAYMCQSLLQSLRGSIASTPVLLFPSRLRVLDQLVLAGGTIGK